MQQDKIHTLYNEALGIISVFLEETETFDATVIEFQQVDETTLLSKETKWMDFNTASELFPKEMKKVSNYLKKS